MFPNKKKAKLGIVFLCIIFPLVTGVAFAQVSSRKKAIELGKKYAGITLTLPWEAGFQSQAVYAMAPAWEKLTGMKIKVDELDYHQLHDKQVAEYLVGTGFYDVVTYQTTLMGDFIEGGLGVPLDPFIEKYMDKANLDDYLPLCLKAFSMYKNKVYGLGDDGDVLILYYRKDIFDDPENKAEFMTEYGYPLNAPPKTWKEFQDFGEFITKKYAPKMYGGAIQRAPGQAYEFFNGPFYAEGGRFFNPETMEAQINSPVAVKVLQRIIDQHKFFPPGATKWDFSDMLSAWLAGKLAMIISWPPVGRFNEGYGRQSKQIAASIPKTEIMGKVGYGNMPGGVSSLAGGFSVGISSNSRHPDASFAFLMWWTSPEISLQVVMLPFAMRDPWRISHFEAPLYRNAWDNAGDYLDTLRDALSLGLMDLNIRGAREYYEALDNAITLTIGGEDPKAALDKAVANWNKITDRLGREQQKEAYLAWEELTGFER